MAKERDRADYRQGVWHYFLNHVEVTQEEYEAVYPPPRNDRDVLAIPHKAMAVTTWRRPVHSLALGVHPDQIEEAKAEDRKRGLGDTEYTADGAPVFRNRASRRAFLKAHNKIDRDSYTGY